MPIYEYQCAKCGTFEATQKITDKSLGRCPTCKGKVKKLISNTSFQLKGTGWYITDYARKDKEKSAAKSDNGGSKPAASESKTETKKGDSSTTGGNKSSTPESSSTSSA
jgi:putative FmdB family regulatory protein